MAKHSETIQGTEKEFLDEFQKLCYSRSSWQVWADLMAAMACSISNVADRSPEHYESREKEYAQCIERLGSVEVPAKMLAIIVEALERNPEQDFLGAMYMQLNLGNHWKGQFFTPYCVCKMMSEITCEDVDSHIEKQGYLSICDPACGAGATLIAAANTMKKCKHIQIVEQTREQAEEYAKDLSAEQVYVDMLCKIVDAPTTLHMKCSVRMLIPIIDRKLRERGL